jgi:glycosyltransferase involved in cell wall biosynthesis
MSRESIRVLHIVDKFGIGGVQKVVQGLLENFKSPHVEAHFYFLRDPGMPGKRTREDIVIRNYAKYSPLPLLDLCHTVRRKNIHILHTHQRKGFYLASVLGLLLPEIKHIHQEHGDLLLGYRGYTLMMKLRWSGIARLVAVSEHVKRHILHIVRDDPAKVVVLNNFVSPLVGPNSGQNVLSRTNLEISPQEFVIGFVGRLRKVKGCEYLIRALPYLDFPYRALIVGDGDQRAALERLARDLKVSERVRFLGWMEDASEVYPLLDVLVLPSLSEAFPVVLLEARCAGVPVICSRIPALCDLVENRETGLFFEPEDERDLADQIVCLRRDPTLRERIVRQSSESAQRFSVSAYCRALEELYHEIAPSTMAR